MSAPVVFLHGIGGGAASWHSQVEHLTPSWRAMTWNMPGYGGSPPLDAVTFPALADRLAGFLDDSGLDDVHLVGHSIGGMVAQEVAHRHPSRLRSLVLVATSPAFGDRGGDFQKKFLAARLAPLDAGRTMAEVARSLVPALVGTDPDPAGIDRALACMSRVPAATYRAYLECLVTFDRRDALSAISVPTLLIAGANDTAAPASMMERMAARIPGAEFARVAGAGHLINLERPREFDRLLTAFLTRVDGARPSKGD